MTHGTLRRPFLPCFYHARQTARLLVPLLSCLLMCEGWAQGPGSQRCWTFWLCACAHPAVASGWVERDVLPPSAPFPPMYRRSAPPPSPPLASKRVVPTLPPTSQVEVHQEGLLLYARGRPVVLKGRASSKRHYVLFGNCACRGLRVGNLWRRHSFGRVLWRPSFRSGRGRHLTVAKSFRIGRGWLLTAWQPLMEFFKGKRAAAL